MRCASARGGRRRLQPRGLLEGPQLQSRRKAGMLNFPSEPAWPLVVAHLEDDVKWMGGELWSRGGNHGVNGRTPPLSADLRRRVQEDHRSLDLTFGDDGNWRHGKLLEKGRESVVMRTKVETPRAARDSVGHGAVEGQLAPAGATAAAGPPPASPRGCGGVSSRSASQWCAEQVEPALEGFLSRRLGRPVRVSHQACLRSLRSGNVTALAAELCRSPRLNTGSEDRQQCLREVRPLIEEFFSDS